MQQYQVLARKYRPKTFDELLGQAHVSTALTNAIDTGRLHHAYLFTGTRGVGKTTIARILAKCLNCETGVTSRPCGVCEACTAVDEGRFLDLIEIDAASRTKVEDTRELLENVPYAPVQGRYKVYLIDEVHMLSTHSFNALLKTLEEPPEHVKFLFATTDPQKLPITIISRCLQFVLRPLPQSLLSAHLHHVLECEHISHTQTALWQLASAAKGSVRDALSLTDQAIAFGGGQIHDETVNDMLGLVNSTNVLGLLLDIYQDNRSLVAKHIEEMRAKMVDALSIFDAMADALHQMAMIQILDDVFIDVSEEQKQQLLQLSALIPKEVVQLYYDITIKSRDMVRLASTPMQALEMGILRLLAFRPLSVGQSVQQAQTSTSLMMDNHSAEIGKNSKTYDTPDASDIDKLSTDEYDTDTKHHPSAYNVTQVQSKSLLSYEHRVDDTMTDDETAAYQADVLDDIPEVVIETTKEQAEDVAAAYQADTASFVEDVQEDAYQLAQESLITEQYDIYDNHHPSNQGGNDAPHASALDDDKAMLEGISGDAPYTNDHSGSTQDGLMGEGVFQSTVHSTSEMSQFIPSAKLKQALEPMQVPLEGQWTAEKWDCWAHTAYQEGILSADEFALAAHALITGEVLGEAILWVQHINYQTGISFKNLAQKIQKNLGTQLDLQMQSEWDWVDTPNARHQKRRQMVLLQGQKNLATSPVMSMLASQGYLSVPDTFLALSHVKPLIALED